MPSREPQPVHRIHDRPLEARAISLPPEMEGGEPVDAFVISFMNPMGYVGIGDDRNALGLPAILTDETEQSAVPGQRIRLALSPAGDAPAAPTTPEAAVTDESKLDAFLGSLGIDLSFDPKD